MEKSQKNIISSGVLVGIVLLGLAVVLLSLKHVNLRLLLQLKKK